MFNLPRLLRFLGRVLLFLVPFLLVTVVLAFLTEYLTIEGTPTARLLDGAFWLGVGLNTLPAWAVMLVTLWLAGRFVMAVYGLDGWRQGIGFILRSRFGLPAFGPWTRIRKGQIDQERANPILEKIGGPGHLVVYNDSAALLEQAGQLTQVEGAGFPALGRFEKVYDVVDLRPRRWVHTVEAMTKEGIPVHWQAEVHYQVGDGGKEPSSYMPFPLCKEEVFRASMSKWVLSQDGRQTIDWEARIVLVETERCLRSILARWRLDQLVGITEEAEQTSRESIQAELEAALRKVVPPLGSRLLKVKLDNLQVADDVTQQWISAWKARWERWSAGLLAQGEASHVYLYETVKAEAQMQLLAKIVQAFQRQTVRQASTPQLILMRLFSVLDRAAFPASSRIFFPSQALGALEQIRSLVPPNPVTAASVRLAITGSQRIPTQGYTQLLAIVDGGNGLPAPDGILVFFETNLGNLSPDSNATIGGEARAAFLAGNQPGQATVTARAVGSTSPPVTIEIF
jgi:hypothetical protein